MIPVLGPLQRLERGRVFVLPLEPPRQLPSCLEFGRPAAFNTESVTRVDPFGARDPPRVALLRDEAITHVAD